MRKGLSAAGLLLLIAVLWLLALPAVHPRAAPTAPHRESVVGATPTPPGPATPEPRRVAAPAPKPPRRSASPPQNIAPAAPADEEPAPIEWLPNEAGPVAEYEQLFEREARASSADQLEHTVRRAFNPDDIETGMFELVRCHTTVCKLVLRWSSLRSDSYVAAMRRLTLDFEPSIAVKPLGPMVEGVRPIEVYAKRKAQ